MLKCKQSWLPKVLSSAMLMSTLLTGMASAAEVNNQQLSKKEHQSNGSPFVNLALGKPYVVTQGIFDPVLMEYENRTSQDNGTEYELTDGKIAASRAYDAYCGCEVYFLDKNWVGFSRQMSRAVTIDLGESKFIREVTGGFLQERTAAVELPRDITVLLSDDGNNWYRAGGHQTQLIAASQEANRQVLGVSNINVMARYVKLDFEVSMFTFLDEIEVIGKVQNGGRPVHTLPREEARKEIAAPTPDQAGGVHNMYITYIYPEHTGNGHLGKWTKNDFKHVLTHVDQTGQQNGWMFDTVLALSSSGGSDYRTDYQQQQSWQGIIDKLFVKQSEAIPPVEVTNSYLKELNEATALAKSALQDTSRKTKVVVGIPYPDMKSALWGTLDGKDISFNPSLVGEEAAYQNRLAAVEWFINQITSRFSQSGYEHLELAGFYWIHEEVSFQAKYEEKLIQSVSEIIHREGKHFYWIPFFLANGTNFWKELGFDAVMMQPNYYFSSKLAPNESTGKPDLTRLENSIKSAKLLGMSMEVEGDYHMSWNGWAKDYDGQMYNSEYARRKYYAYLNELKKNNLDQSVLAYYLGARTVLRDIMQSTKPEVRQVYDDTYRFAAGAYSPIPIPEHDIALPSGDTWDTAIRLDSREGLVYDSEAQLAPLPTGGSKWLKFLVQPGEEWEITLTPASGSEVAMETRWVPNQIVGYTYSWMSIETKPQTLQMKNIGEAAQYAVIRTLARNLGGHYTIALKKL